MSVSADVRARVFLRSRNRCERCGGRLDGWDGRSLHHRRPRGMGGTRRADADQPQNLMVLCGSGTTGCHGWVEANRFAARADGLLVSQHADPAAVPVVRLGTSVLLLPDGTLRPTETTAALTAEVIRLAAPTCGDALAYGSE